MRGPQWSSEAGNDFSLAQLSFTILILIVHYPCLAAQFRSGSRVKYDHVPNHVLSWPSPFMRANRIFGLANGFDKNLVVIYLGMRW